MKPSSFTITIAQSGAEKSMALNAGRPLLAQLLDEGYTLRSPCGGKGTCGKCKCRFVKGAPPPSRADTQFFTPAELKDGWRLACTCFPEQESYVLLPAPEAEMAVLAETGAPNYPVDRFSSVTRDIPQDGSPILAVRQGPPETKELLLMAARLVREGCQKVQLVYDKTNLVRITPQERPAYAIAVDIGTTTLAMALVDTTSGAVTARAAVPNPQRPYGADVITRIGNATGGRLSDMSAAVRNTLNTQMRQLCAANGVEADDIVHIAIAGNTTMLHLLLELPCHTLAATPFTPVYSGLCTLRYGDLFPGSFACAVQLLPGFSTYVGADIAAGALAVDLLRPQKPALLLDIGTNGEMVLHLEGRLLCTSTAVGPAFEGGNISHGCPSVAGAISAARYDGGAFKVTTIDGAPPIGICGSGLVSIAWECVKHGLLDETGRFSRDIPAEGLLIATAEGGGDIRLTQKDVRELQLGKSAVRAGLQTLLSRAGLAPEEVDTVYLAGGFGHSLDTESAVGIGLLPAGLTGNIHFSGNTSLAGTIRFLTDASAEGTLQKMCDTVTEVALAKEESFQQAFMDHMQFEENP